MSTKEQPDAFDALEKADPDEPIFTLRAHDPLAPDLVHLWVKRKRDMIRKADPPLKAGKLQAEMVQCANAENVALEMTEWFTGFDAVETDEQEVEVAESNLTDEQLVAKARYDDLILAKTKLHNAVAEINEAIDLAEKHVDLEPLSIIRRVADQVKEITIDQIQPKGRGWST